MKIFLTALAACALVACSGEPTEQSTTTDTNTDVEMPADTGAAKAQVVSLKVAGMT